MKKALTLEVDSPEKEPLGFIGNNLISNQEDAATPQSFKNRNTYGG